MNKKVLFSVPENAVFWLMLIFLAAGSAASLYARASGRVVAADSGRVISPIYAAASEPAAKRSPHAGSQIIRQFQTDTPYVALTLSFSDNMNTLDSILETLASCDVHATFFLSQQWIQSFPHGAAAIAAAGHDVGIQSDSASKLRKMTPEEIERAISETTAALSEAAGTKVLYFRPPEDAVAKAVSGSAVRSSPELSAALEAARKLGLTSIAWDVDSMDWKDYGADAIVSAVSENPALTEGSILRLHGDANYTSSALLEIIESLWQKGFAPGPISKLYPYQDE